MPQPSPNTPITPKICFMHAPSKPVSKLQPQPLLSNTQQSPALACHHSWAVLGIADALYVSPHVADHFLAPTASFGKSENKEREQARSSVVSDLRGVGEPTKTFSLGKHTQNFLSDHCVQIIIMTHPSCNWNPTRPPDRRIVKCAVLVTNIQNTR